MSKRRRIAPVWTWLLAAHALSVLLLWAVFLIMTATTPPDAGANIGAGLVGLVLVGLGLPWSIPAFLEVYSLKDAALYLFMLGPSVLNVVVHAAVYLAVTGRRLRSPSGTTPAPAS
ncbi:MAG: hypothetical protein ACRDXX_16625 [Stackebrandtia sp.]